MKQKINLLENDNEKNIFITIFNKQMTIFNWLHHFLKIYCSESWRRGGDFTLTSHAMLCTLLLCEEINKIKLMKYRLLSVTRSIMTKLVDL